LDEIIVMMGGRAAEMLVFEEQTAGASNDIERATRVARAMVIEYGMSKLGPMNFGPQYEQSYSRAWGEPHKISANLQEKVDLEIRNIIKSAQTQAVEILKKHRKQLDAVSAKLLAVETLDTAEFVKVMGMSKTKRPATKKTK
jgi:cell division protease FtsH